MFRLVLLDMDMTLIPFQHLTVTPQGMRAVHELIDAGIHVGPASGRGLGDLKAQFCGDESCLESAVVSNGCQIIACGRTISRSPLDRGELEAALAVVKDIPDVFFTINDEEHHYILGGTEQEARVRFDRWVGAEFRELKHFPEQDLIKVNLTFCGNYSQAKQVVARLEPLTPSLDFCVLNGHVADIMPKGLDKAAGARMLVEHYGITADDVLVFGDSDNDLPLFRSFPNAVAMANAIPAVRDLARWHIGPCTEDACAEALLELAAATRAGREPAWMSPEADAAALDRALHDEHVSAAYLQSLWSKKEA